MVKYYHLEAGGGKLTEITEGEYEFRLRKHCLTCVEETPYLQPGHGFESPYGTCFCVEVNDNVTQA